MSYFDKDQRLNQRVHINDIVIEGLLDIDADVRIITLVYWHTDWSLEDFHFLEIGTLFHVKQSTNLVEIMEPEGQKKVCSHMYLISQ